MVNVIIFCVWIFNQILEGGKMLYSATKKFRFEMAHVLDSSYSEECQNFHGHSYQLAVTLTSDELNEDGMVVDFKKIKDVIGDYIKSWDHTLVISEKGYLERLANTSMFENIRFVCYSPTAEMMCVDMFNTITKLLSVIEQENKIVVSKIRLRETESGWAECFLTEKEILNLFKSKDEEKVKPVGICRNGYGCEFGISGYCYDIEKEPCKCRHSLGEGYNLKI